MSTEENRKKSTGKSKKSNEIDPNVILEAVKSILIGKKGIRTAAREYNIPKSTLDRYKLKIVAEFEDLSSISDEILLKFIRVSHMKIPPQMIFSIDQESDLKEYIVKCMNHYYGLSPNELRELAYQLVKKLSLDYTPSRDEDGMASRRWYYSYMKRHPELVLRTPEQTSLNRVKAFCKANVDKFFTNLGQLMDEHTFVDIYNMDESGFSNVPNKIGKVIALKGMRRVGKIEAAEKGTMITMALAVGASGNSIPPFFIFPQQRMQTTFSDNTSKGTLVIANGSGWMCQPDFFIYMQHFVMHARPSTDRPVLLILDNHTSHLSVQALDFAAEHGVHILSLPPHTSHKLQPLDVSVFGPLKAYYKSQCSAWQKNNANQGLEIRLIPGLVCKALELALLQKTIKSGFEATGISPFNPDVFTDADFVQAVPSNKKAVAADADLTPDEQRSIVIADAFNDVREEVVTTSADTSRSVSVMSAATSFSSIIDEVGPLQAGTPKPKSNRGRKAMQSAVLTSPESLAILKESAAKRAAKKAAAPEQTSKKKPAAKKTKTPRAKSPKKVPAAKRPKIMGAATSTPKASKSKQCDNDDDDDEDVDFCIGCLINLPKKLTSANSVECVECTRPVCLDCGKKSMPYICKNCLTDSAKESESEEVELFD